MIHLVFVHGVNTRKVPGNTEYQDGVDRRHGFFKKYCFPNDQVTFYDPYWGSEGADPRFGLACIPLQSQGGTTLSLDTPASLSGKAAPNGRTDLLEEAKINFEGVVNTLSLELTRPGAPAEQIALAEGLVAYALDKEKADGTLSAPSWVTDGSVKNDQDFLERLETEAQAFSNHALSLGVGGILKRIGSAIVGGIVDSVSDFAQKYARQFTPKLVQFLGDAFVYIKNGEARKKIREVVLADLQKARLAHKRGDKIIVVCHSMGANIVYDMYTDPDLWKGAPAETQFPLQVDLFVSVGTQLGLLEELSLFPMSPATGSALAQYPAPCGDWWHVFNLMDVLSFRASGIFDKAKEFSIDTSANIIDAHTAYFTSILFHRRLNKRLKAASLIA